ncbi:flagellin hook IN motif-containing protein, partial [Psychromonas hadalis]|uniref:flagellin N-terminal helical domain-containing protein n=1 Tax=Psychromonas hadalis TaxID=211669 RepID=UPI0003B5B0C7
MAQVINTNIMSLNAQRQLNKSQLTQNEAMERLSSGLRINSAKDDAAGLAISTGMQSQIRGINQAVRNANDGISMTQTAEGSMNEMTNILQRMRELSVQSANDTNSASNREAIQKEVDQLHNELDRIASTTEFNGVKLLDGSSGTITLQIGANSGETLSFSLSSVTTNALGLNGGLNKAELNGGRVTAATTGTAGEMLINGIDVPASDTGSAVDIAKAINSKTAETGVTASAYNVVQGDDASTSVTGVTDGMTIKVGGAATITLGATSSMSNLV